MRISYAAIALVLTACTTVSGTTTTTTTTTVADTPVAPGTTESATTTTTSSTTTTTLPGPHAPPEWLGSRPLPLRPDGFGEVVPTPPELVDRAFATVDLLDPPSGEAFESSVGSVPPDVLARSTWDPACPVGVEDLAYLTVAHWGFDGVPHTGELLVDARAANEIVEVFSRLYDARFPIEQMRVIRADELDAPPTGDGNITTAFVCRPAVGSTSWSMHAHGLAIDINPFHNPYLKGDLVLPELASAYTDRDTAKPGMITEGDVVTTAFDDMGWYWGGRWSTLADWMHFSANNR